MAQNNERFNQSSDKDMWRWLNRRWAAGPNGWLARVVFIGVGMVIGALVAFMIMASRQKQLVIALRQDHDRLKSVQEHAQDETNALAMRLSQLQAQATRLNALGQRLTDMGKLQDGEFDFQAPEGIGDGDTRQPSTTLTPKALKQSLLQLEHEFSVSGQQLDVLATMIFDHQLEQNTLPVRAPIQTYVTSGFGYRIDPFTGQRTIHSGVDFHAQEGDPIKAVADGVVSYAGSRGGYGKMIEIDHRNGFVTRYAHNAKLLVHVGDLVRSGQTISKAGSTGRSTGPHVHFEVWVNGKVMNPMKFLAQKNRTNELQGTLLSHVRSLPPDYASPKLQ